MKNESLAYTIFAATVYLLSCLVVIPVLVVMSQRKAWHAPALRFHMLWARVYFFTIGIDVELVGKEKLSPRGQYIFCSNHFSFLDIPAFYLLCDPKFIGKSSLTKIPLFGYFFRKIHIPVNRSSSRSRAESLRKSKEAIDEGHSLAFFPEGGIVTREEELPRMAPFKDGAFILAREKGVPIVPITMPYNFLLLPDKTPFRFTRHKLKIVVHDAIDPADYPDGGVAQMKQEVFNTIQAELLAHHPGKVGAVG